MQEESQDKDAADGSENVLDLHDFVIERAQSQKKIVDDAYQYSLQLNEGVGETYQCYLKTVENFH